MNKYNHIFLSFFVSLLSLNSLAFSNTESANWPTAKPQSQPWSRWWWMGSAVDKDNLSYLLQEYKEAGIGGLEICPIYGAKGYEDEFLDFLSPEWIEMLDYTLTEAEKLGIGIDLTTGTGWPFGGPWINKETASTGIILKKITFENDQLSEPLPKGKLIYLTAIKENLHAINLLDNVINGKLDWDAPEGKWSICAAAVKCPVQKVKRAAPGGDGYVMDPYSVCSLDSYLEPIGHSLKTINHSPRCHFHDSFEYYGATWTLNFFDEFQNRRGYDLKDHFEALFGIGQDDTISRIMSDYHQTINDMHLEVVRKWTQWCHSKGSISRNQAHGAPANLVDLYAASDIPETEIFRSVEDKQLPMLKFSSSAAHLNGSSLVSSETFTWLNDHFQTNLTDLKEATDFMLLGGINHIFFHGIPYSPKEAAWPGWQFYASVNFSPQGGLWKDLPGFNAYITRCQSILQSGKPDNSVLLYFPVYDLWHNKEKLHMTFTVHNQEEWLYPSSFHRAAIELIDNGYSYDDVSDSFIDKAEFENGKIVINNTQYETIVIPHSTFMPAKTLTKLLDLADKGATVLFQEKLPDNVPGFSNLSQRQDKLQTLLNIVQPNNSDIKAKTDPLPPANVVKSFGKGKIMIANLLWMLKKESITREGFADYGIDFIRCQNKFGSDYFIVNRTKDNFEGWVTLGKSAKSAILMDPLFDNRIGKASTKNNGNKTNVYIQLKPNESIILRTFSNQNIDIPLWTYTKPSNSPIELKGDWTVEFIDGGPVLPKNQIISSLSSWTAFEDPEVERFHGTARYTLTFDAPAKADDYILDLGQVCSSAKVLLNSRSLGTTWSKPFKIHIGRDLIPGKNTLQIEVTNLAANRIRDLDIKKVNWKYFYNINLVNINYKPFDASGWPVFDSGLIGPVQLIPLKNIKPENIKNEQVLKPTIHIIGDSTVHNSQSKLAISFLCSSATMTVGH